MGSVRAPWLGPGMGSVPARAMGSMPGRAAFQVAWGACKHARCTLNGHGERGKVGTWGGHVPGVWRGVAWRVACPAPFRSLPLPMPWHTRP